MLHLTIYAVVPDKDERNKLLSRLRHHNTPFTEIYDKVSVETNFLVWRSVEKLLSYFESVEYTECGFSVVGEKGEIPNDS